MNRAIALGLVLTFLASCSLADETERRRQRPKKRPAFRLTEVRSLSGEGNLPDDRGAAGQLLLRLSAIDYPDGLGDQMVVGPNPRRISNAVTNQWDADVRSRRGLSDAVWAWGQFIDHDIGLTESDAINGTAPIDVPDPEDLLSPTIFFNRSNHVLVDGVREHVNEVSAFLDASQVYGSDQPRARALRTFRRGRMKTSPGNLLPRNEAGMPNLGGGPEFFLGGDVRTNENVALICMHTLFVREHNRVADRIARLAPQAGDEQIYQLARKIVAAETQIITYREFLPALLGPLAPEFRPQRPAREVDPGLANEFSTALFRVGHTMLSSGLQIGESGEQLPLRAAFANPDFVRDDPAKVGQILLGLTLQRSQEIDPMLVDDVRTFLFLPPPFSIGLDLAALNIQRGRDHGLPNYNVVREAYGLPPVSNFAEITRDRATRRELRRVYGNVNQIDPWIGAICEDHLPGASVGPLIAAALNEQFCRLRDGDRFFFHRDADLRQPFVRRVINFRRVTLGRVIGLNTDVRTPRNVFFVRDLPAEDHDGDRD